jgi:WD40 repeat protein
VHPAYSPDGTSFACTSSNGVWIVRTNGTGRRVVATFSSDEGPDGISGLDWTPDGKWLLVTFMYSYAALVEVSTGTVLPLRALPSPMFQALFVR